MRLLLALAIAVAAPGMMAHAQQPQIEQPAQQYGVPAELLTLKDLQGLPPEIPMMVEVKPFGVSHRSVADIEKLLRSGEQVRRFKIIATDGCVVNGAELRAERKASDDNLRRMKASGENVTVIQQYEQEMYYEARFAEFYEKACGKKPSLVSGPTLMMRERICKASEPPCKAKKHW